jgi:hypothetical protein
VSFRPLKRLPLPAFFNVEVSKASMEGRWLPD